jgi:RimJ/RimL family protein N-acetyltransferase
MSQRPDPPYESALAGQRVRLRPVGPEDYERLYAWASQHAEAPFWCERRGPRSFAAFCREREADAPHERTSMLVEWRVSARPIGWIAADDLASDLADDLASEFASERAAHERECALVFYLTPAARAFGGADEALALFLDHVFATLAVDAVHIEVVARNVATELLARRLGFAEEGRRPRQWVIEHRAYDVLRFGLRRDVWEAMPRRNPLP